MIKCAIKSVKKRIIEHKKKQKHRDQPKIYTILYIIIITKQNHQSNADNKMRNNVEKIDLFCTKEPFNINTFYNKKKVMPQPLQA